MIREISIQNIALIDDLTISFDEGFNVLTGETGAGKSIIIDSVNLALGERADRELIQTGKDFARVELLFSLPDADRINGILEDFGITPEEDGTLLLMRELTSQGKNLCKVNGRSVTLSMLREISRHLVDVHGQHHHQSLLSPESHIDILDRFGGTELAELKSELRHAYLSWQDIKKEISKILGWNKDGERRRDILKYQIDEIVKASLKPGEEDTLRKERTILLNAEKIATIVNDAYNALYTGGRGTLPILDGLAEVVSQLRSIQDIDQTLDDIAGRLENLQYTMEDSIQDLRVYRDSFEYDPDRLEQIESRLNEILVLKRKYGSTIEDILKLKAEMEAELDAIDNSQERLEALYKENDVHYKKVLRLCEKTTGMRKKCAAFLEKELTKELAYLNMNKTVFKVNIVSPDYNAGEDAEITGVTENGCDTVEFLISPNPGEPLKPLSKIISGGEMSRVMLAFKSILGELDEIPTMIFDEIDVGISGRTAQKVAEKIGSIARNRQVICVTHLPQIASMADCHFVIEKTVTNGHTRTNVTKLNLAERKYEIARMIGGSNLTPISLEHAGELIESALQHKESSMQNISQSR
ncbi:MAG TPA: DNA repair protein RecN [Clostridiales bacterium]|nr:DNA repair protein RecN [Clostridiales bacterium]